LAESNFITWSELIIEIVPKYCLNSKNIILSNACDVYIDKIDSGG